MKRKKKILTIIAIIAVTLIFILPAIGFSILNWGVLPPEKLTPLVVEQTNKFLDAHLDCERVELTFFETYPYLGIKLTNGHLISHTAEDSTAHEEELAVSSDSLLSFNRATVSLQPLDYLFGGKITIKNFSLDHPRFYGFVNKDGRANWDIYQSEADSAETDADKKPLPPIDLQRVRIRGGHFTYDDRQADLFAEVNGFFMRLDGSLAGGANTLDFETGCSSILFSNPAYTLKNDLALRLKSRLVLADHYNSIMLKDAELMVNNLPFTADGAIRNFPEDRRTRIDMDMGLKISDMNDLLKFIPDAYFQDRDKILAEGSVILEGNIHGFLADSIIPNINLCCKIENGSYHVKGVKQGIDTLAMDLDIHLNGPYPDSSFISLEQLNMKGLNTALDIQAKVNNLFRNPAVNAKMKGQVDFTKMGQEFLNPDTLLVEGVMDADFSATFTVDDLLESRFGKIHGSGKLSIDKLKAFSQPLGMDIFISDAYLAIDTTHQKSRYLEAQELMRMTMGIDSLNIKYKDEISTNISKLEMLAQTSPVIDTTAVIPMTGRLAFEHLRTRMPDSVWMVAGRTELKGGIKSSASDKQIPTAAAVISVDTLKYISVPLRTGLALTESRFTIEALPYRDARRQQMANRQQRIPTGRQRGQQTVRRRDSTDRKTANDSTDISDQLLRKWEARGDISFKQMRGFSRLFPLPMWMEQTTMKFNTNDITLTDARLHLGKSDLTLNGEVSQIRRAMLRGGKLKGNFKLSSDYIDCNQLMQAINSGMQYAAGNSDLALLSDESIAGLDATKMQDSISQAEIDTTGQLFVLPAFLDMALHTDAKRIDFKDLELENVTGEIVLRDQSINLSKLNMESNMGHGNLTMVYTARNEEEATAGFDLDMENVQVERLIALFPSIDTLVPMLRSFEGVLGCEVTATCKIDSTMSLVMPSINSSCYLHGNNMVLLDGETFAEISKTLMFKNKKRNVIDSIAVDLAIKDNKIEVFPFLVEMDRYRVAVGGTHNLDMTFNYHVSVLKSPVPFKLGIDITGNLDDFKYKITKCKYKDIFKPAKQAELDSTRKNIRKDIRDAIRKQIEEAAPELGKNLALARTETKKEAGEIQESPASFQEGN